MPQKWLGNYFQITLKSYFEITLKSYFEITLKSYFKITLKVTLKLLWNVILKSPGFTAEHFNATRDIFLCIALENSNNYSRFY